MARKKATMEGGKVVRKPGKMYYIGKDGAPMETDLNRKGRKKKTTKKKK